MRLQIKNNFIETSIVYFVFFIFSFFIVSSFGLTMPDDGWRHLAMAIYPEQINSWGELYPFSLYSDFDPWFMWHKLLRFINSFVDFPNIQIVINTFIFSFLSLWYYLALSKFTKINKIFILIFAVGLPILNTRYFFLRPDILSGLFILYFLISKNKIFIIIISLLYTPFYYIFWFYLAYLSYIQLVLQEYKRLIILISAIVFGLIFYLYYDFHGYIQITQNILNNDILTQQYSVGESKPFILPIEIINKLGSFIILFFLIIFSLLVLFTFKPKSILSKYIILFSPLFFMQFRFLFILQPIIYVFVIYIISSSYKTIEEKGLSSFINIFKNFIKERTYFGNIHPKSIQIVFLSLIIIFFILQLNKNQKSYKKIENNFLKMDFLRNNEFKNKRILFSSMSISNYIAVFINPSAEYIPNCSLGWVTYNKKDKKTYFDLLINNDKISMNNFFIFLEKNNPDYLIIDTSITSNLKFDKNKIEKNGFTFYKIINSKLIFRKIQ